MIRTGYSTTTPVTTTVTSYVPIPTLELVRSYVCAYPAGALIEVTVRSLADAIGRGKRAWGAISPALKRLEHDGYISYLPTPAGSLIEILRSDQDGDRSFEASPCDQALDRPPQSASPTILAPAADEVALTGDQGLDRMSSASECDQGLDRADVYGTSSSWNQQQQQQHDAHACEQNTPERVHPAGVTRSEWEQMRAAAPAYTETDLRSDLAKLATRGGIINPVGVIIAALRVGEPIYSRQELQERAAVLAPPPAEPVPDPRPPAPRRERRRSSRAAPERHIEAPPLTQADLDAAAALEARVRALAPDGDHDDIGSLIIALTAGATDEAALAKMHADRAARSTEPTSEEVFDALREHTQRRSRRFDAPYPARRSADTRSGTWRY